MLGADGLTEATKVAILNANYIKARLEPHYPVLYTRPNGRVAHELIFDLRGFKAAGDRGDGCREAADRLWLSRADRLVSRCGDADGRADRERRQGELDRFCDAMIQIRKEIEEVVQGRADKTDNVLKNAPHTAAAIAASDWSHPYSREQAAFPLPFRPRSQVLAERGPHR